MTERGILPPDLQLGHYRIIALLGAGGAGQVYHARDTRLGRSVAIKILTSSSANRTDAASLLEREARVISQLKHPHICVLHDIGEHEGLYYLVMEYLEGKTLSACLHDGPLPIAKTLEYATQVAGALDRAHSLGVIHRDLKANNIMITPDGAKLLDFGLAKMLAGFRGPVQEATLSITAAGVISGTVPYMSPEQALEERLDGRTDVFSLGVLLYLMVTNTMPFKGKSAVACFDAILHYNPPLPSSVNPAVPPELEGIILRALEKNRDERYQSAAEIHEDLVSVRRMLEIRTPPESGRLHSGTVSSRNAVTAPVAAPFRRRKKRFWITAAAGAAVLALAGAALWWKASHGPPALSAQTASFSQLTDLPGQELTPSLSPDGKSVAYAAQAGGNWDIYLQRVGGRNPINLTRDSALDDTQPSFSPDGERIAFRSEREGGGIFVMGATGESVKRLSDAGYFPSWSPDGERIVASTASFDDPDVRKWTSGLVVIEVSSGRREPLTIGQDAIQPNWSPHGERIAYWSLQNGRRHLCTVPWKGGAPVCLTDDLYLNWNPVWSPDGGNLYFASNRGGSMNLWRLPVDEKSGKALGAPVAVTTPSPYSSYFSFSRDGSRLAYAQSVHTFNLYRVSMDPTRRSVIDRPTAVTQGARVACCPVPSPDGQWLAFGTGAQKESISLIRPDGQEERQLTDDSYLNRQPRWSPDGKLLAFHSNRSGHFEVWTIRPDGSGLNQLTSVAGLPLVYAIWSADGKRLAYSLLNGGPHIFRLDRPWDPKMEEVLPPPAGPRSAFVAWDWSPDGDRLVGDGLQADGSRLGILIYSFRTKSYETLADSGSFAIWLNDGRSVLFQRLGRILLADRQTHATRELLAVPADSVQYFGVSRDQRVLYFNASHSESDIWLLSQKAEK